MVTTLIAKQFVKKNLRPLESEITFFTKINFSFYIKALIQPTSQFL